MSTTGGKISTKKNHELGLWWCELKKIPIGEGITAGRMALLMGVSRTTAQRRLRELVAENAAIETWYVAANGFSAVRYGAI